MPSSRKQTLAAAIGFSLVVGLAAACTSASADSPATTTEVACNEVSDQLVSAQSQLTDAQAAAEEKKGTPGESEANDAVSAAQTKVVDLNTRKTTCDTQATTASPTPEASTSASPTTTAAPADPCPGSYVVKLDANAGANLFSQGLSPDSETMRQQVLDGAKTDPRVLQVYYNASPLGQASPIQATTDIAPITDGACFTPAGKAAYDQWVVLWKVTKLSGDTLPEQGTNTGAEPGGSAFQETGLIPAGTGMKVVYVDANGNEIGSHKVRLECGNVVMTSPIALPPRPEHLAPIVSPPPPPPAEVTTEAPPPGTTTPPQKCEWPTPHGEWPNCKDDPSRDVLNNPDVPAQVKGPGTTPIGGDPGPASQPTDSPTGCRGTCNNAATATAAPANPAMTQPVLPSDPPQVSHPDPVLPGTAGGNPTSESAQTGAAPTVCDANNDGLPDDGGC